MYERKVKSNVQKVDKKKKKKKNKKKKKKKKDKLKSTHPLRSNQTRYTKVKKKEL